MIGYRITKFNPKNREPDGRYLDDDWTSVADVGKKFKGKKLLLSEYLSIEDAYVETVRRFLRAANVTELQVKNPERKDALSHLPLRLRADTKTRICFFPKSKKLSGSDIDWVVRLNLRELFWCRLQGANQSYVHFGWDYYMYLGTNETSFVLPSLPRAMYPEVMKTPYK